MKLSEEFPSKWLKGDDLGDNQPVVKIEDVTVEEFDDRDNKSGPKKKKLALHFAGKDKGMICNVGMRNIVIGFFGDDTDDWIGRRIKIMAVPFTNDKGETSMVCRIHPKQPASEQAREAHRPKPVPELEPTDNDGGDDNDGGIPF